jgi:tRNA nucleotidyltransferase (CCA-adding enzyme)
MSSFIIPNEVSRITRMLKGAGYEAYLVGGCVRDLFLGYKPKDWDVTTNAKPEEIIALFPKTFYENDFGTVGVVYEDVSDETLKIIEVTPYRTEGKYTDKRRPDTVSFDATLLDDLNRRDFTVNSIALDIEKNDVVDPYSGRLDLQKGILKAVGDPNKRFEEDSLRVMRGVRLSAELGFVIEENAAIAIEKSAPLLVHIAKERIRDEFTRLIMSDQPLAGLELCKQMGIIPYIVPELVPTIGVTQNQAHAFDVWTHLLKSLQHAADKKWPLVIRLTALFHDISKPQTRRWSEEKKEWTFYGHEVVGERVTRKILKDLRFSKEIIDHVSILVRWHMFFSDTEQITLSAVRRMVSNVGKDRVWDLMNVRACDRIGTGRPKENPYRLRKYKAMVEEVLRDPVSVGMLAINGTDILNELGIKPGPRLGFILHALLELVLDEPKLNSKNHLLAEAKKLNELGDEELRSKGMEGKEKKEKEEQKILKEIRKKHWIE